MDRGLNEVRNDSINLAFKECSNRCKEVKYQQLLVQEEFKKLQCQFEKQAKAIDFVRDGTQKNLQKLFNELNIQRGLINRTVLRNRITDSRLAKVEEQVKEGQDWSREMENGQLVVMMERIQKLEDRMAEKDAEIAAL